jgi:hypothetical protein
MAMLGPPRAGQLAYDRPSLGAQTIGMTASLTAAVLDGVTQSNCEVPRGMQPAQPAPAPASSASPYVPASSTSTFSWAPILIGLAALAALGGISWVIWRKRSSLKRRIKG